MRYSFRRKDVHEGWRFRRGDIYYADLGNFNGSVQGGKRPVLVLQNNVGNVYAPTLVVAPLTSHMKKEEQPTHFMLYDEGHLAYPSMVLLEQITTINKQQIIYYIGKISKESMAGIDDVIRNCLGMQVIEDVPEP